MTKPSTKDITGKVLEPYKDCNDRDIDLVGHIYKKLEKWYNCPSYFPLYKPLRADVNFEHLFHVLEMLDSYRMAWKDKCHNDRCPVFAPFTKPAIEGLDYSETGNIISQFIIRIMDIINDYNQVFEGGDFDNNWYRDFFARFHVDSDFFILNYDTTIENSIKEYEDGYEPDGIQEEFMRFNPSRLFRYSGKLSTVNHLHGCVNYYFSSYKDANQDVLIALFNDLYKYKKYETVKDMMMGRGRSNPMTQSGESYYPAPIITGLRKTEKLNCAPFDFYHANMINCIVNSPKLVIIGYGFGDLYCNQLLERMHFLHNEKRRIVLIDKWNIPKLYRKCHGGNFLSNQLGMFLCRVTGRDLVNEVVRELYKNEAENDGVLYSENGCLMVLPNGFKQAAKAINEIECFLGR